MAQIFASPSKYIQSSDALAELASYVAPLGKRALAISSASSTKRVGDKIKGSFEDTDASIVFEDFNGECSMTEIDRLGEVCNKEGIEVVIGIGGGKTLDTAKAVGFYQDLPVVICPTIASSDAPCSSLSVVYTDDHAFDKYLYLRQNPNMVLMDTTVIAASPVRLTVSGMGDALATYFEAKAVVAKDGNSCVGGKSTKAALALAKLCFDTLMADGVKAKIALDNGCCTKAVENIIEANTLLSGIGFESAGLAAAHAIHNGLTQLPETHDYFHGEKVAFGTLTQLVLENDSRDLVEEILSFCVELGLPVTLAQIGITDVTREKIMKVATAACAEGDTMGNMPFEVTPEMVCEAILGADALGHYYTDEEED